MDKSELNAARGDGSNALAASQSTSPNGAKSGEIVVDVRFHPNGLVNTINHLPERIGPQEWFDRLCRSFPSAYRPLSGGRAAFRIQSDDLASILRQPAE